MTETNIVSRHRLFPFALVLATVCAAAPLRAQAPAASVAQERVWDASEVTQSPQLANQPQVARLAAHSYPASLRALGVAGRATLELVVGSDGRVEQVLDVAATHASFARVARSYSSALRFRPASVTGRAVRCRMTLPVDFAPAAG